MCRRSGNPPPTGSTVCHNTTLRSSGARGLDVLRCYRHVAPLERKASQINALHRRVRSPCAGGWGTHPLRVQPCATIPHCAPLERGYWRYRRRVETEFSHRDTVSPSPNRACGFHHTRLSSKAGLILQNLFSEIHLYFRVSQFQRPLPVTLPPA